MKGFGPRSKNPSFFSICKSNLFWYNWIDVKILYSEFPLIAQTFGNPLLHPFDIPTSSHIAWLLQTPLIPISWIACPPLSSYLPWESWHTLVQRQTSAIQNSLSKNHSPVQLWNLNNCAASMIDQTIQNQQKRPIIIHFTFKISIHEKIRLLKLSMSPNI